MQVVRVREKRPSRLLFSAWLQSAYIEVPLVQLKRADLDKACSVSGPSLCPPAKVLSTQGCGMNEWMYE